MTIIFSAVSATGPWFDKIFDAENFMEIMGIKNIRGRMVISSFSRTAWLSHGVVYPYESHEERWLPS